MSGFNPSPNRTSRFCCPAQKGNQDLAWEHQAPRLGLDSLAILLAHSEVDEYLAEQASTQLAQAGQVIGSQPGTLQLRYLQTLSRIAGENNKTVIFSLPIDLKEGPVRP